MKVVIPVAGSGTRLRPHTLSVPKPLLHVGGKAMLDHIVAPLVNLKPEEVIFVVGHKGQMIIEHIKKNYPFKSRFVPQEKLLGLGYALHLALETYDDEPTLIILGDTIVECNCHDFLNAGDHVLGLKKVDDPKRFGIAEIRDGYVAGLEEKPRHPKTNLALIGLYYFRKIARLKEELRKLISSGKTTRGEIQFTDALHELIRNGMKFTPFEVPEWYDCGKKETLLETNRNILKKLPEPQAIPGTVLRPPVFVAPTATVEASVIGPDVSISDGAVVRNSVVTNSIIGSNARVVNMVLDESLVGHKAVIQGSIRKVNIGEATEIENI